MAVKRKILCEKNASGSDMGDWNKTVEYTFLCCGNVEGNNNKFLCFEIQVNSITGHHRIFSNRGRINSTSMFDIREFLSIDGEDEPLTYETAK
ncbi:MAG: hypothetical protein GY861_07895, partial [bacterium]|nr:hypothetical protein [bacterium]